MKQLRPFRFGLQAALCPTRAAWIDQVRRAEALGYSTVTFPDHLGWHHGVIPLLSTAAANTERLRVGTLVLFNGLRHPAVLARDIATLDVMSDGRVEVGLGIGSAQAQPEFESIGLPFPSVKQRMSQLEESVQALRGLFGDEPLSFSGEHYEIHDLDLRPKPVQRPHPPILIGGARPRMLGLAARNADIVSISVPVPHGRIACDRFRVGAVEECIRWIRDAAGDRVDEIELSLLAGGAGPVTLTNDTAGEAERRLRFLRDSPDGFPRDVPDGFTTTDVLDSPFILLGSVGQMVEKLIALREMHGISYLIVEMGSIDDFAPVVEQLSGT